MAAALAIIAATIVAASGFTMVFPAETMATVNGVLTLSWGIWFAVAIRLLMAILLWGAASRSRTPNTFRVLAVLMLAAAIAIPFLGAEYLLSLVQWFEAQSHWLRRAMAALGLAFGGFILWSVSYQWARGNAAQ